MRKTTSLSLERVCFYSLPKSTPTFASYPHTHDTGHVLAGLQATFTKIQKRRLLPAVIFALCVCVLRALLFGLELPLRAYLLKGRGAYNHLAFPFSRLPLLLNHDDQQQHSQPRPLRCAYSPVRRSTSVSIFGYHRLRHALRRSLSVA